MADSTDRILESILAALEKQGRADQRRDDSRGPLRDERGRAIAAGGIPGTQQQAQGGDGGGVGGGALVAASLIGGGGRGGGRVGGGSLLAAARSGIGRLASGAAFGGGLAGLAGAGALAGGVAAAGIAGQGFVAAGQAGTFGGGAARAVQQGLASIPIFGELFGAAPTERISRGTQQDLNATTNQVARFGGAGAITPEIRTFLAESFTEQQRNIETDRQANTAATNAQQGNAAAGQGVFPELIATLGKLADALTGSTSEIAAAAQHT